MPELANLRVETVEELENAIATVFEKALANEEFCDVYADVCAQLETKYSSRRIGKSISLDNLYYSSLLGTPPHKIAELFVFPRRRVACGMGRRAAAQVLRVQADRAQWAIQQPQSVLEMETGSGLDTEQLEHVKQRKEASCRFLSALFRHGVVEEDTMLRCIEMPLDIRQNLEGDIDLLHPRAVPDEINLNVLCALFESAGSQLESRKNVFVSKCFWLLKCKRSSAVPLSAKLAARVHAVIDLRRGGWDAAATEREKLSVEIAQVVGRKRGRTE
ncbi:hypothetical protein PC119_g10935 [Phytophthora cactorum]|nr:hypothetical protein PC113_g7696 [Phytophthora cactorum]KAG3017692.1 hypothetical protein PC119_g10935 [Phytophthora cactorum]